MKLKRGWRRSVAFFTLICLVFSSAPMAAANGVKRSVAVPYRAKFSAITSDIKIAGRAYKLIEQRNARGRVTRQILLGQNRTEISIDQNGTGKLDSWELMTPNADITMHGAFKGKFTFMDVIQRTHAAQVTMKFSYNRRIGQYQMYALQTKKYQKLSDQDFVVGCRAHDDQMPALDDLAKKMSSYLDNSNNDAALRAQLEQTVLGPSCKTDSMKKKTEGLVLNAIMQVAHSDKDWSGGKPATRGQFLQCLRFYDLGTHASRISAGIAQYMPVAGIGQGNPWTLSCGSLTMSPEYLLKHPGADKELGSFDQGSRQVTLNKTAEQLRSEGKMTDKEIQDEYAHVYFHEMIHYSQIEDEPVTHALEDCCSQPEGQDNGSCKTVESLLKDKVYAQRLENAVINVSPDYAANRDSLNEHFGPMANAMVDDFYTTAGRIFQTYEKKCDPKSANYAQCKQEFFDTLGQKVYDDYFKGGDESQCMKQALVRVSHDEATKFCKQLEQNSGTLFHVQFSEAGKASACRANPTVTTIEKKYLFLALLFAHTPYAHGADDPCDPSKALRYEDLVQTGLSAPPQVSAQDLAPDLPAGKDGTSQLPVSRTNGDDGTGKTADPTGSFSNSNTPASSQTSYQRPSSPQGPDRPIYSNDSPTRQRDLLNHIEQSDSILSKTRSIADRAAQAIIPQAQASENDSLSSSSGLVNPAQLEKYTSHLPALTVPDPLLSSATQALATTPFPKSASAGEGSTPSSSLAASNNATATAANSATAQASEGSSSPSSSGGASFARGAASVQSADQDSAKRSAKKDDGDSPAERKARETLLGYLQGPYSKVSLELSRPRIVGAMLDYKIQVVDDKGRVHGSGFPKYKFVYDSKEDRLLLQGHP